ncbi:MAG: hypothetical protein Q9187_000662 [Circinaria calcarea]
MPSRTTRGVAKRETAALAVLNEEEGAPSLPTTSPTPMLLKDKKTRKTSSAKVSLSMEIASGADVATPARLSTTSSKGQRGSARTSSGSGLGSGGTVKAGQLESATTTGANTKRKRGPEAPKKTSHGELSNDEHVFNSSQIAKDDEPRRKKGRTIGSNSNSAIAQEITAGRNTKPRKIKVTTENEKKVKAINFRQTPYPDFVRPTAEECHEVVDILSKQHGEVGWKTPIPAPSRHKCGCGEVPEVIDAVCRTIISGHLDMKVADKVIGIAYDAYPNVRGTVDWNEVRNGSVERFCKVFKDAGCGLGPSKVKNIKDTLDMIYQEGKARREAILSGEIANLKPPPQHNDVSLTNDEDLTLEYLRTLPIADQFNHLYRYAGVGVKTAACILLFAFQQPALAVDTHVLRLSKWLGWMPAKEVKKQRGSGSLSDADACFFHIDAKVPDELKYSVHQQFIRHGQNCLRCKADTNPSSKGWDDCLCPIEHLVTRVGPMKTAKPKKAKIGKGKAGQEGESGHEDGSEVPSRRQKKSRKPTRRARPKEGDGEENHEGSGEDGRDQVLSEEGSLDGEAAASEFEP